VPGHPPIGERIELLGLPVHVHDLHSLLRTVDDMIAAGGRFTVGYANVHTLNQSLDHPAVAEFARQADVVYCDGNGIRVGAALLGDLLPARMTGADWIWDLANHAAGRGLRLFWLGGREGVAAAAADRLRQVAPDLQIAGTHHGYFEKTGPESEAVVERINRVAPDIVLVGFGTPLQERWVLEHRRKIDAGVVWVLGATADFVSGAVPRGPSLLYDHGFEWLSRLLVDPRRLWHRYLLGNTRFLARVLSERRRRGRSG